MRPLSELRLKVLDLGCGDGTTAIPAAKLGAEVLGVDIASNDQGKIRHCLVFHLISFLTVSSSGASDLAA